VYPQAHSEKKTNVVSKRMKTEGPRDEMRNLLRPHPPFERAERSAPVSPKSARTPYQNSPWKQKDAPKLPKEKRLSKDTPAERLEPRKPEAPVVKPQVRRASSSHAAARPRTAPEAGGVMRIEAQAWGEMKKELRYQLGLPCPPAPEPPLQPEEDRSPSDHGGTRHSARWAMGYEEAQPHPYLNNATGKLSRLQT
jgi:hypothetical protein